MDSNSSINIGTENNANDEGNKSHNTRSSVVRQASNTWKKQLTDLSGRNTLLYYRNLKVGTLDLSSCEAHLEPLLKGNSVALTKLFPDEEILPDARRRARRIYKKAQEHYEERGIETLFLAYGTATWAVEGDKPAPRAPILLQPAILVPKGSAQEEFELQLTGEMHINGTLLHFLATEYGVDPDQSNLELGGAIATIEELNNTINWLEDETRTIKGFNVSIEMMLGTFSYMKLPMVRDLEDGFELLVTHDLISALAGDDEARRLLRERYQQVCVSLDDPNRIPPADEFLILDADASQNYAINAVLSGQDLIIQGPPGTGKSQTIANLIATLIARGKRILFVAEKRAAIDAVLKRIDSVGLTDLVFDLHGGVAARRQIAQELARSLEATGAVPFTDYSSQLLQLERRRNDLEVRTEALHRKRAPWGVSVHEAQVLTMGTPSVARTDIRLRGETLDRLNRVAFIDLSEDLSRFVGLGGLRLASSGSLWAGANITSQDAAASALALVDQIQHHSLSAVDETMRAAIEGTSIGLPDSVGEWKLVIELWSGIAETLSVFSPELFLEDLEELCKTLEPAAKGRLKRIQGTLASGEYRTAKKTLRALAGENSVKTDELFNLVSRAYEQASAWFYLTSTNDIPTVPGNLDLVIELYEQLLNDLMELRSILPHLELEIMSVQDISRVLKQLREDQATLRKLPELHRLVNTLDSAGLSDLLDGIRRRELSPELCKKCLEYTWLQSIIEHVSFCDALVGTFDGVQQTQFIGEFVELDKDHMNSTSERIRRLWAERVVGARDSFPDQGTQVKRQASRKRKLMPFRELFKESKDLLLALKPCWVMSPLVVSQSLPTEPIFDVVIFDEASQIRPADAIPAIARGKQLVIAGDKRQLPPTTFFDSALAEDEEEDEEAPALAGTEGFESILDTLEMLLPFKMLTWHYRSHDERLIAFSNAYLYDHSLTTFPGVSSDAPVSHILVPFEPGRAGQETSVTNEVREVVRLVIEHAEEQPENTLGVIAMGIKHANRIDEALRLARAERPDLDDFFMETREERFFVKNLERVQGDERDSIILSVGYGKSPDGRMLYRFGPINNKGGERRLNVAVTRARKHLRMISSFSTRDLDPERLKSDGAKLLRAYMQYAERGASRPDEKISSARALNPFEIDVRDTLVKQHMDLVPQLGVSGYWIDFAVKHPEQQGKYILAIECDGASYHSIPTVRDRDRLRQEQLERLGWRFHRIWSTEWFSNKDKAVDSAIEAYRQAVAESDDDCENDASESPELFKHDSPKEKPPTRHMPRAHIRLTPRPPVPRNQPIDHYSRRQLVEIVKWIESDTLLRTTDELVDEVMKELGFSRHGTKIVSSIRQAIQQAHRESGSG